MMIDIAKWSHRAKYMHIQLCSNCQHSEAQASVFLSVSFKSSSQTVQTPGLLPRPPPLRGACRRDATVWTTRDKPVFIDHDAHPVTGHVTYTLLPLDVGRGRATRIVWGFGYRATFLHGSCRQQWQGSGVLIYTRGRHCISHCLVSES